MISFCVFKILSLDQIGKLNPMDKAKKSMSFLLGEKVNAFFRCSW
jgi:hypothetical protein